MDNSVCFSEGYVIFKSEQPEYFHAVMSDDKEKQSLVSGFLNLEEEKTAGLKFNPIPEEVYRFLKLEIKHCIGLTVSSPCCVELIRFRGRLISSFPVLIN